MGFAQRTWWTYWAKRFGLGPFSPPFFTLEICVYIERILLYTTRISTHFRVYWVVYQTSTTYLNSCYLYLRFGTYLLHSTCITVYNVVYNAYTAHFLGFWTLINWFPTLCWASGTCILFPFLCASTFNQ